MNKDIAMPKIPSELKKRITSPDPGERESAAAQLRDYSGPEAVQCLIKMLSDERSEVVHGATQSLVSMACREAAEEVVTLLRSEDAALRNLAFDIIVRMGATALSRVERLINDGDRDVRKFAVDILRMMRVPGVEDPLIKALFDEDINVAMAAAEALGNAGTLRAVPHLIDCARRAPWLKYAAIKSLGEIGGEEALRAILATDPEDERIVLFYAVNALGTIGDSRGIEFLINLLEKDDPSLLPSIIQAAARILKDADDAVIERAKRGVPGSRVVSLLGNNNSDVVRSAIVLLGLFREERAIEALVRLYNESNEHLFEDLEQAFLTIRSENIEPFMWIIKDPMESETVKTAAVRLMGRLGRREALEPLVNCLDICRDKQKAEVICTLGALNDPRILPVLHEALEEEQPQIKETAIEALETFCDEISIPFLMELSADSSETVRSKAAASLRRYDLKDYKEGITGLLQAPGPEAVCFGLKAIPEAFLSEFKEDILGLCLHNNETVRKKAVERCSFLEDDMAYETIVNALKDEMPGVRLAAIRRLENHPDRDAGRYLLIAAGSDLEEWNRYEAVRLIGLLKLSDAAPGMVSLMDAAPDLVKAGILDALGELGDLRCAETVNGYIGAENESVKEAAVEAMEKLTIDY